MKILRELIFYSIQFLVLLVFANLSLMLVEASVVVQALFLCIVIVYYSLGSNTLEYIMCGYVYKVRSDKLFVKILSIILRVVLSLVLIYMLMLYFYETVFIIFIFEFLTQELNGLSIFEFLTISNVEKEEYL